MTDKESQKNDQIPDVGLAQVSETVTAGGTPPEASAEKRIVEPDIDPGKKFRRPEGVVLIAIYHFLISIPGLLGGLAIILFAFPAVAFSTEDTFGLVAAFFGLGVGLLFTGGIALLLIFSGIGLLMTKNWARWLAVALAMPGLLFVPVGTIIGGIIIWYLLRDETRQAFKKA